MFDIERLKISKEMPLIEAIKRLNDTGNRILLVIENNVLIGVLNDGDIRRWILKNEGAKSDFTSAVSEIMNSSPIYLREEERELAVSFLEDNYIEAVPIVNSKKEVVDIVFLNKNFKTTFNYKEIDVPVVIMAGGKGTRLYPYTKVLPKPLIPVNNYTILENIIYRFMKFDCKRFYLSVNYKKSLIKAYVNELTWSAEIHWVEEEKYLGTCGSLKYLQNTLKECFIVTNCDILIQADYADIVSYHKSSKNLITIVAASKEFQFPYGVLKTDSSARLLTLEEKPVFNFQVNTGFYVLNPEVFDYIHEDEVLHMTQLIEICQERGENIGVYIVPEAAWLDMGEMGQLDSMMMKIKRDTYGEN